MERIKALVWPTTGVYKPLEDVDESILTADTETDALIEDGPVPESFKDVAHFNLLYYLVFVFIGLAMLWPW